MLFRNRPAWGQGSCWVCGEKKFDISHLCEISGRVMTLKQRTSVYKALGHPARLRMVDALAEGERCVCELVETAGLAWSTVSRHLAVLKQAGIVDDEKRGQQVYYSLRLHCITDLNRCLDEGRCGKSEAASRGCRKT